MKRRSVDMPPTCRASAPRRSSVSVVLRYAALGCVALYVCAASSAPKWQGATMHYAARGTPLADALKDVLAAGGIDADIGRDVRGTVNGVFDEEPASLFLKLTEAYGLLSYFDGRAMHVTTTSDVRSRVIPFAPMTPGAVASLLRSLDLDAPAFPIRYANTSIKVSGPSRYVAAVADAVDKAQRQTVPDVPFDETSIRVFPLRYAQAQDLTYTVNGRDQIVPGVATLLRNLMRSTFAPRAPAADKRNARSGVPPLPGLRGTGMADISLPQTEGAMSESVRNATQDDVTPSRQNIAADARTNSVVIYDVPAMMPHYQRAIAMLDQPQELIEIDAAVIDLTSGLTSQLGVQWGGANGRVNLGVGTAAADSTFRRPDLPGVGSLTSGLNFATLIGNSTQYLFSQIQALEENGKARIVSRPQVLTLNNSEAVLSSRSSVYVRVAGNQDVDLYNVDTGLSLKVTPMVESGAARDAARDTDLDAQKNIRLNIQIDDGAFNTSLTVDGIPNVNNHSIVTQAVVRNGESLLIGGYQYDRNETTVSKVPMLGDVPYLGTLFRNKKATHERLERLILITPHIRRRAGRGDAPSGSGPGSVRAAVAPTQPTPTAVVPNANVAPSAADPRRAVAIYPAPPVDPLRTPSSARDVPPLVQTLEQKR